MIQFCAYLRAGLSKATQWLCIISASVMSILVILQILFRFFHTGYGWTDELSRYFMVWMAMFSASLMVADNADVRLDFVIRRLPRRLAGFLEAVNNILIFVFLGVLCYFGFVKAISAVNIYTTSVRVSMMWFYLAVPVGAILMMVQLICRIVINYFGREKVREEEA